MFLTICAAEKNVTLFPIRKVSQLGSLLIKKADTTTFLKKNANTTMKKANTTKILV
jgi:hypothetical protein